jgi:hypothetical protein
MSKEGNRRPRQGREQGSVKKPTIDEILPDLSETGTAPNPQGVAFDIIDQFNLRELRHRMIVQKLARVKAAKETNTNAQEELKNGSASEKDTDSGLVELNIDLATLQGLPEKDRRRIMRFVQFWKMTRGLGPKFVVPAVLRFEADNPQEERYTQAEVTKITDEIVAKYMAEIVEQVQARKKFEKDTEDFHWSMIKELVPIAFPPKQAAPAPWSGKDTIILVAIWQVETLLSQYSALPTPNIDQFNSQLSSLFQKARGLGQELYSRILAEVADSISSLEATHETNDAVRRNKLLLLDNFAMHLPEAEFAMLTKACKGSVGELLRKTRADLDSQGSAVISDPSQQPQRTAGS